MFIIPKQNFGVRLLLVVVVLLLLLLLFCTIVFYQIQKYFTKAIVAKNIVVGKFTKAQNTINWTVHLTWIWTHSILVEYTHTHTYNSVKNMNRFWEKWRERETEECEEENGAHSTKAAFEKCRIFVIIIDQIINDKWFVDTYTHIYAYTHTDQHITLHIRWKVSGIWRIQFSFDSVVEVLISC